MSPEIELEMADSPPFAELLAQAGRGDRDAMIEVARQYESEIRVMARVLLGPALRPYLDSMDLVQSVHRSLMVHLRAGQLDVTRPDRLLALALTMIRRKVARQWRRHRRQHRLDGTLASEPLPKTLTKLCSPDDDPERTVQIQDTVQRLCDSLQPMDRQIMELRLQGFSTPEVAHRLNLDADGLRVRLSRLRHRLRSEGVLDEWL
jgi:RNA polymerase sigma factor (sigma-70 family)